MLCFPSDWQLSLPRTRHAPKPCYKPNQIIRCSSPQYPAITLPNLTILKLEISHDFFCREQRTYSTALSPFFDILPNVNPTKLVLRFGDIHLEEGRSCPRRIQKCTKKWNRLACIVVVPYYDRTCMDREPEDEDQPYIWHVDWQRGLGCVGASGLLADLKPEIVLDLRDLKQMTKKSYMEVESASGPIETLPAWVLSA